MTQTECTCKIEHPYNLHEHECKRIEELYAIRLLYLLSEGTDRYLYDLNSYEKETDRIGIVYK